MRKKVLPVHAFAHGLEAALPSVVVDILEDNLLLGAHGIID